MENVLVQNSRRMSLSVLKRLQFTWLVAGGGGLFQALEYLSLAEYPASLGYL